jgi:hypothetical protein
MFDHLERDRYDMQEYTAAPCLQDAAVVSRERPKHRYPHTSTTLRLLRIWPDKKQEIFFVKKISACDYFCSIANILE